MSEHHILFSAGINPVSANNFMNLFLNLRAQGTTKVVIAMNTEGGNVVAGITLYNALRALPYGVVTHNIGNVDSIGNVVFLGGTERYAAAPSTFMFHGVGFDGNANERLEEANLRAKLDTILSDHRRISAIMADRTQLSAKQGMALFKAQTTRSAQWALDKGLVHGVSEFAFPTGGNVHIFT